MRAKKKRKREEKEKKMFLVLRRSMQLAHQWRRWSLISSALNKSIAAALDPSFDVMDGAFPVASAIDIWARDPPAVSTLPAHSA